MNNMTYKIKENAKNVWIRNNENTQDLSPLTDANSVYFNNGRTLQQELGKGAMESNVVTIDSTMSKVIDEVYDGVYESCVFKGKSLVNLVRNTGVNLFSTSGAGKINKTETSRGMIYETSREDLNAYITIRTGANPMMKPNTSYTIFFEIVQNTIIKDGQSYKGVTVCGANDSYYNRATNQLYHNSNFSLDKGVKSILVTTGSDVSSYDGFGFGFPPLSSGGVEQGQVFEIQNVMVIEGDCTNQDIPYFKGLCDSKMPILRNVGKNLFDGELELGTISSSNGVITPSTIRVRSLEYLMVNSNTTYTLSNDLNYANDIIYEYDENLDYIGRKSSATFTTSTNCKYIKFSTKEDECDLSVKYQLEEGSAATERKPYKTNILRTSEEVVLCEVNGVQDTYNPLTGEYVKRIGECVLDGSQALSLDGSLVYLGLTDRPINNFGIADKMPVITVNQLVTGEFGICIQDRGASGRIYINIEGLTTREEILQHLRTNPITIHYGLVEPVTTVVEPSTIPFIYQNGHIILESGYKGQSLTPILEYTASVSRTGQVENVAKAIQRHETQLALLEKMLIGNIIELDYNNTLMALNLKWMR